MYKYLLVGDRGVGKSSVLLRRVDDEFSTVDITTMGKDYVLLRDSIVVEHILNSRKEL